MLRRFAYLFLILAVMALSACAAGQRTPTPTPVEITFVYPSDARTAHYEQLKKDFEAAHPQFHITLRTGNPYRAISSGTDNVSVAEVDQLSVAMLAEAGQIRILDPMLGDSPDLDLSAFYPGTVDALRWQGQLLGLPADVDPWLLYYNKDMFDKKGLSHPTDSWDWNDFLDAAEQLTEPSSTNPVYGYLTTLDRADFVSMVYQNGGTLVDNLVNPKTVTFDEPATIEAIEWYINLSIGYGVAPTPRELSSLGNFEAAVVGQRGAMWFGPFSEHGGQSWDVRWPFQWGAVVPPHNKAEMALITMRGYVISANAEKPLVAWEWVKYMALHPATDSAVPPLRSVAESKAFTANLAPELVDSVQKTMEIGHTIPPTTWMDDIGMWLGQAITSVYDQSASVADAMATVQEKAEAILQEQASK